MSVVERVDAPACVGHFPRMPGLNRQIRRQASAQFTKNELSVVEEKLVIVMVGLPARGELRSDLRWHLAMAPPSRRLHRGPFPSHAFRCTLVIERAKSRFELAARPVDRLSQSYVAALRWSGHRGPHRFSSEDGPKMASSRRAHEASRIEEDALALEHLMEGLVDRGIRRSQTVT